MFWFVVVHTLVHPVVEYAIHYTVHKIDNSFHREHHSIVTQGRTDLLTPEYWCIGCMFLSTVLGWYLVSTMFLRYWVCHQYIHTFGDTHHTLHHRWGKYNFGVTSKWVDKMFGTYK